MRPSTLAEALEHFEPVIGLEVHAQLRTDSKIFCGASTQFIADRPNQNIQSYCIGLPGVLPVINQRAVKMAVRTGLALGCTINGTSSWSRKHYFYPDLPKGYQISQFDLPICEHGTLTFDIDDGQKTVRIGRIHMEEDAGKNTHVEGAPYTLVDYNRAGVPLVEIVSEPDLRSAQEAGQYLRTLRSILTTLEVCDGNMEEGSFRCDANVSIRERGVQTLGVRCEIKNVNSFRYVEQAIEHEILRHARILAEGGTIQQQTRLFDPGRKETRAMRSKEEAHDYRYFPDPDLPPLVVPPEWIEAESASLPELPAAKIERWTTLGVPDEHARVFAEDPPVATYFDRAIEGAHQLAVPIAHLVKTEVLRETKTSGTSMADAPVSPQDLAELVKHREAGKISASQTKKIFNKMWTKKTPLADLLAAEGEQVGDASVLAPLVADLMAKHPKEVIQYREGKTKVISFFMGQVMKATRGKANPKILMPFLQSVLTSDDPSKGDAS
jgi:aspartyl-tRNA(Asn)/glutamyl-tRNA(Gln) amidotransferase subunit B